MPTAQQKIGAVSVDIEYKLDGQLVFETQCKDADQYESLSRVVSYRGVEFVKTGWSSDTNKACYKSGRGVAYKV